MTRPSASWNWYEPGASGMRAGGRALDHLLHPAGSTRTRTACPTDPATGAPTRVRRPMDDGDPAPRPSRVARGWLLGRRRLRVLFVVIGGGASRRPSATPTRASTARCGAYSARSLRTLGVVDSHARRRAHRRHRVRHPPAGHRRRRRRVTQPSAGPARGPAAPRPGWRPWPRSCSAVPARRARRASTPLVGRCCHRAGRADPAWRSSTGRCSTRRSCAFPFGVLVITAGPRLDTGSGPPTSAPRATGGRVALFAGADRLVQAAELAALRRGAAATGAAPPTDRAPGRAPLSAAAAPVGVGALARRGRGGSTATSTRCSTSSADGPASRRASAIGDMVVVPAAVARQPARPVVRRPDRLPGRAPRSASSDRWRPWRCCRYALYAVVFRQAAAGHQYWNYWVLLPTAVGWAYLLRAVVGEVGDGAHRRVPPAPRATARGGGHRGVRRRLRCAPPRPGRAATSTTAIGSPCSSTTPPSRRPDRPRLRRPAVPARTRGSPTTRTCAPFPIGVGGPVPSRRHRRPRPPGADPRRLRRRRPALRVVHRRHLGGAAVSYGDVRTRLVPCAARRLGPTAH